MNTEKSSLQATLEICDLVVRSYSGRGMWGKECLAVECDDMAQMFSEVLYALDGQDDLSEAARAFQGMRVDSLGHGTIVYFPYVEYVEESQEEEPAGEDVERAHAHAYP